MTRSNAGDSHESPGDTGDSTGDKGNKYELIKTHYLDKDSLINTDDPSYLCRSNLAEHSTAHPGQTHLKIEIKKHVNKTTKRKENIE